MFVTAVALAVCSCSGEDARLEELEVPEDVVARIVFFRAVDCAHCEDVYETVIAPLQERCGASLDLKLVDVGTPEGYEAFVATEEALIGEAGRWNVPAVAVEGSDTRQSRIAIIAVSLRRMEKAAPMNPSLMANTRTGIPYKRCGIDAYISCSIGW